MLCYYFELFKNIKYSAYKILLCLVFLNFLFICIFLLF